VCVLSVCVCASVCVCGVVCVCVCCVYNFYLTSTINHSSSCVYFVDGNMQMRHSFLVTFAPISVDSTTILSICYKKLRSICIVMLKG